MKMFRGMRVPVVLLGLGLSLAGCGGVDVPASCTADSDCFPSYACDLAQTQTCLRSCTVATDCVGDQVCDIPGGATSGVCRIPPGA